jgi:hypothetical protein
MYIKTYMLTILLVLSGLAHADDVTISQSVDESDCTLIRQDICKTRKKDAMSKCEDWHKENAKEKGANTIVITDTTHTEARRPFYDGSVDKIKWTHIAAKYYSCENHASTKSSEEKTQSDKFEERLMTLEALYKKRLITDEEYKSKRVEILRDL